MDAESTNQQELIVLGSLMLDPRMVWDVEPVIEPGDFADGRHEVIYRAIVELAHASRPTDAAAVADHLNRAGLLKQIGGEAALHPITDAVLHAGSAPYYADALRRAAVKRRLTSTGLAIAQMGQDEGDADELAERARAELDQAIAQRSASAGAPIGDDVAAVLDSLSEAPRYTPTPWAGVNDLLGGFRPGALYVIGARPGSGKSIMGLQAAAHLAEHGQVAFSSLEMSRADLIKRMFAFKAPVSMDSLNRNRLSPLEWERVARVRPEVMDMPLVIDDRSGVTLNQVRSHARSVSRRGRMAGVVVDYLQLMRASDPKRPRWEAVGEMSGGLKGLARDLDVPVIALCQLNRGTEGGVRRLPNLGDLRESGSIEQDADVVVLIQREYDEQDQATDMLNVSVAKNRHGRTGLTALFWEGHYARVSDPHPV